MTFDPWLRLVSPDQYTKISILLLYKTLSRPCKPKHLQKFQQPLISEPDVFQAVVSQYHDWSKRTYRVHYTSNAVITSIYRASDALPCVKGASEEPAWHLECRKRQSRSSSGRCLAFPAFHSIANTFMILKLLPLKQGDWSHLLRPTAVAFIYRPSAATRTSGKTTQGFCTWPWIPIQTNASSDNVAAHKIPTGKA